MGKMNRKFGLKLQKVKLEALDDRILLLNLYLTQGIALLIAFVIIWLQPSQTLLQLVQLPADWKPIWWGAGLAAAVLAADFLIEKFAPKHWLDDGGINERLFQRRPLWHIFIICLTVAAAEELLFRGAVQHQLGLIWTSVIFAAVHIRYLRQWLMTAAVFGISCGLGWIYIKAGSLWAPVTAHFLIDFILGCVIKYRRESKTCSN